MNLKEIRKSKGFTQQQMAQYMAMEQTTYSRKENGKSPITEEEYKALSRLLETSIEELKESNKGPAMSKNEYCTFNDNAIGIQIVSIPKDVLDIILKYNQKLEEENINLKTQLEK